MADELPPFPDPEAAERIEKLRLEKEVLKRQLTKKFLFIEWAKAIAAPVAIGGLIWSIFYGYTQRNDNRRSRDDERFERAIARTGSSQVPERLIGIAGLEQFLGSKDADRQTQSLQYLIDAAVIEPDPTVRSAIEDIFAEPVIQSVSGEALKSALITARDRNRAILKRYEDRYFATPEATPGVLLNGPGYTEVPVGKLSNEQIAPLATTATLISTLIRADAKIGDLSQIYCVECQFGLDGKSVDLSDVDFDGSFLRRANFKNADLSNSSFRNADLVQSWFTSADLHGAKLTADVPAASWEGLAGIAGNDIFGMFGANFDCADLSNSDFSGRAIFAFIYDDPVISTAQNDNFSKANLHGTKLTGFQFLLVFPADLPGNAQMSPSGIFKLFPVVAREAQGPSQAVHAYNGRDYVIWTVATDKDFRFTGSVDPKRFWNFVLAFKQLHEARNLYEAEIPDGLRAFLKSNEQLFSPGLGDPGCKPRNP